MGAPQIILIVLIGLGLLGNSYTYGKGETSGYKFIGSVIGQALLVGLLIWGGFFK